MSTDGKITLYHSPNKRFTATFALLEELGARYELCVLDGVKAKDAELAAAQGG